MKIIASFLCLVFFTVCSEAAKQTDFENMLSGFAECKFDNVYVDYESQAQHPYFKMRNLTPFKIENGAAFFNINETLYGLKVDQIVVPVSYSIISVRFKDSINTVEKKIKPFLKNGYNKDWQVGGNLLLTPSLEKNTEDPEKTVLYCDSEPRY